MGLERKLLPKESRIIKALTPEIELEYFDLGADHYLKTGETLPDDIFERWKNNSIVFIWGLWAIQGFRPTFTQEIFFWCSLSLGSLRQSSPHSSSSSRLLSLKNKGPDDVNFVVFRENTEGLYTGVGGQSKRHT